MCPEAGSGDPDRCQAAGIPEQVGFATKPALAKAMIGRALDAGVPAGVGDRRRGLRRRPGAAGRAGGPQASAMCWRWPATTAVRRRRRPLPRRRPAPAGPGAGLAVRVAPASGAKGHRLLRLGVCPPGRPRPAGQAASTGCWSAATAPPASWPSTAAGRPARCSLATLVRVAGRRWTVEERFQTGKGLVGLDQHQVRRWRSWYRWTTLAMLAHAFLVVLAAADRTHPPPTTGRADQR